MKYLLLTIPFVFLSFYPAPAFEKAETRLFIFYYTREDSKAGAFFLHTADRIARRVSESLGFSFDNKVEVFLVTSFDDFKKIHPEAEHIPSWAVGAAYPAQNIIVLLRKSGADLEKTFSHELNHILLGQAFKGKERVPRWLDEGLAMIQADEWNLTRLATMTTAVLKQSLLPMDSIADSFPADLRDAELAYCQSFYFIAFLKGRFGDEAFKNFLKEYCKYKNFQGAIRSTYRLTWNKMEGLWLDYLTLRFSWAPLITSTSTIWFVATLIFLLGYVRKKRKSRRTLKEWEQEELLSGSDDTTYN
ncbi:MAG: peptidase MA family metallohydrolase [Pseudomonadota bacterium]